MAAAIHAFLNQGFAATSIEQVAASAGVSKVTVYSHFGDKRGLFTAAVEAECNRMRDHFTIDNPGQGTVRERLTAIGQAMVAFLSRPEMIQFDRRIAAETETDPEIGEVYLAAGPHRIKRGFVGLLRAMGEAGEVRIDDYELAAEQFVSMCKGMGDLERRYGHCSEPARDQARIAAAVEVFCGAYMPDDGKL